ncbi:hypothetical protein [Nostoc sp.]
MKKSEAEDSFSNQSKYNQPLASRAMLTRSAMRSHLAVIPIALFPFQPRSPSFQKPKSDHTQQS